MDVESLFKHLVWDSLVEALVRYVTNALAQIAVLGPLLASGPIVAVLAFVIQKLTDKLYEQVKLVINMQDIVFVNYEHQRAFESAAVKLKIIAHDKGVNSDAFKQAREDERKALSVFVHRQFNGSPS